MFTQSTQSRSSRNQPQRKTSDCFETTETSGISDFPLLRVSTRSRSSESVTFLLFRWRTTVSTCVVLVSHISLYFTQSNDTRHSGCSHQHSALTMSSRTILPRQPPSLRKTQHFASMTRRERSPRPAPHNKHQTDLDRS